MTGEDGKVIGAVPSMVRNPEGRGVCMQVLVVAEGVRGLRREEIDMQLYPHKRAEESVCIVHSDLAGTRYEVKLMIAAAVQQTGRDAVRAVAAAARVPIDRVKYTSLGAVVVPPSRHNPGSTRRGMRKTSCQGTIAAHR